MAVNIDIIGIIDGPDGGCAAVVNIDMAANSGLVVGLSRGAVCIAASTEVAAVWVLQSMCTAISPFLRSSL